MMLATHSLTLDKQAHILAGAAIALAAGYFAPVWAALALAVSAGAAKEVYDRFHPERHTGDANDFWATALGGIAGSLIALMGAR